MITAFYEVHLTCDGEGCKNDVWDYARAHLRTRGDTQLEAEEQAKQWGWKISPDGKKCLCSTCVKQGVRFAKEAT